MIPIPSPLVEFILLGPLDDRRQLQDSPILGDVWVEFGKTPDKTLDLLISPYKGQHAGYVAGTIDEGLGKDKSGDHDADIAYLQGLIVAGLTFEQMCEIVVPKTKWWLQRWSDYKETWGKNNAKSKRKAKPTHEIHKYIGKPAVVVAFVKKVLDAAAAWHFKTEQRRLNELPAFERFIALAGLVLWGGVNDLPKEQQDRQTTVDLITYILENATPEAITKCLGRLPDRMLDDRPEQPLVWQISMNRIAMPAINKSVPAVKADAAKTLFKVNCSDIAWAVLDSGIDGNHPAFQEADGTSRVRRSFDFKNYRRIVNLSNLRDPIRKETLKELKKGPDWKNLLNPPKDPDAALLRLAEDARGGAPIHWDLVEKFVEIKTSTPPASGHGTHVAGIIGASKDTPVSQGGDDGNFADGMCPDISLYDFRVLGVDLKNTEFAIIAALQFIRYLNSRNNFTTIHGANLSLSIPHDVRNFACGRTPICDECERLIESGVVVVAAAGNHGYKSFETKDGSYDSYAAFSITDPGNADGVITVGATHRYWPHTYGVSFFSSRGPTGDGRLKPDLVAPGERIHAPLFGENSNVPGGEWGDLDGTSMAAPHVSGAAAMLMARYSELVGQPRRIKRILCENATDLGRERSFQGHGMLDVLRAFQAI
jgi:serine protease AprX